MKKNDNLLTNNNNKNNYHNKINGDIFLIEF